MADDHGLPDYLINVVAREAFEKEVGGGVWDDLDDIAKAGWRETAVMILKARAAQSDIKR